MISCFGGTQTQKTHVVKRTLNPVWGANLEFTGRRFDIVQGGVHVQCFDRDTFTKDDFLGEVSIDCEDLYQEELMHVSEALSPQGRIELTLGWTALEDGTTPSTKIGHNTSIASADLGRTKTISSANASGSCSSLSSSIDATTTTECSHAPASAPLAVDSQASAQSNTTLAPNSKASAPVAAVIPMGSTPSTAVASVPSTPLAVVMSEASAPSAAGTVDEAVTDGASADGAFTDSAAADEAITRAPSNPGSLLVRSATGRLSLPDGGHVSVGLLKSRRRHTN